MTKYEWSPKSIRTTTNCRAWWYAERNAIELYVDSLPHRVAKVRLQLSDLREFVRRADEKAKRK